MNKLFPNWLIIKPNNLKKIGGIYLPDTGDTDFINVSGEIVKMCDELRYDEYENGMQWDVEMELRVGDKVWYNPLCNIEAADRSKANPQGKARGFTENGEFFMFVHYQDIFVAQRGERIICPNGWVLGERVEHEVKYTALKNAGFTFSGKFIDGNDPKNRCVIRHIGSPVREYKFGKESESVQPDDHSIKQGDEVLLMLNGGIVLDETRKELDNGKTFYRFRRQDVIAKIIDNKLCPVSDRIFIKEIEETLPSGLILPKADLSKNARKGVVVGHGGLCREHHEHVYYSHAHSVKITFNDEEFIVTRERKLLADFATLL